MKFNSITTAHPWEVSCGALIKFRFEIISPELKDFMV